MAELEHAGLFAAAEAGHSLDKAEYEERLETLRVDLLNAQFDLPRLADFSDGHRSRGRTIARAAWPTRRSTRSTSGWTRATSSTDVFLRTQSGSWWRRSQSVPGCGATGGEPSARRAGSASFWAAGRRCSGRSALARTGTSPERSPTRSGAPRALRARTFRRRRHPACSSSGSTCPRRMHEQAASQGEEARNGATGRSRRGRLDASTSRTTTSMSVVDRRGCCGAPTAPSSRPGTWSRGSDPRHRDLDRRRTHPRPHRRATRELARVGLRRRQAEGRAARRSARDSLDGQLVLDRVDLDPRCLDEETGTRSCSKWHPARSATSSPGRRAGAGKCHCVLVFEGWDARRQGRR